MGLTSGTLVVVLLGLAVLAPVAAVVMWSRIRGPRPVRMIVRLAMVVSCQVAAVAVVAAAVNDYGYFYGSWTDLGRGVTTLVTGAPGAKIAVTTAGPGGNPTFAGGQAGDLTIGAGSTFSTPAQWPVRGRLETVRFSGAISNLTSSAYVYLPPQYFQAKYAHVRFPAAEVFSGYPGTGRTLISRLKYQDVLLHDIQHHRAHPMVLVMLRPAVTFPRDTECTDVPAGPQALTFFAQDVPLLTGRTYRVQPTGWGTIGDSTGGYCAAKVTMLYPSIFHAAASLSGYYNALGDSTTGDLWGGSPVVRHLNDLEWRLGHMPAPPVSILATSSRDERGPEGISDTRRFLKLAHAPMQVSSIIEAHGGHNFQTWGPELPRAVSWLSRHLPLPDPA